MKIISFFLIILLLTKALTIEQLKIDNGYGIKKHGTMTLDEMPIKMDVWNKEIWNPRRRSLNKYNIETTKIKKSL
ncbi:hypothetical protein Mgra_00000540 [Meloidogyne graminicola]|uniref:Uncharacterized protein n=1 Tax=Meloidogyne graminicola TaxID=189291 RepID=A0A8T0A1W5_9BILA|nr:hypothetical protein Mgra_00000540 [Meloidogyne graminicola]